MIVFYGCIIIGPSGSGKTTLCNGLSQYYSAVKRKYVVINLDPANDQLSYDCKIDMRSLIDLNDVMEEFKLGPNGALLYCYQFLEENIDWLLNQIEKYKDCYLIFDMPGQIELYLNSPHVKSIFDKLKKNNKFELSLAAVSLFDCYNCYQYTNYISIALQALTIMMNLELPHINVKSQQYKCLQQLKVLSKIDLLKEYGQLPLRLSYYFDCTDLNFIAINSANPETMTNFDKKYFSLNSKICELLDSYSQCIFMPLRIEDKIMVSKLVAEIDKKNSYYYNVPEIQDEEHWDLRNEIYETDMMEQQADMLISLEEELGNEGENSFLKEIENKNSK